MYPIGHFALGYFSCKLVCRLDKEKVNYPMIFFLSILPDIDIYLPFLEHRGPTHSIVLAVILFIPIYMKYRHGLAYFASLASHSLIGDYFTAYGVKLFWPLSLNWYKANQPFLLTGRTSTIVEISLFVLMIISMLWKSRAHGARIVTHACFARA